MFVHRTDKDRRERRVVMQALRDQLDCSVYVLHRLDRPASGIVLFGLSSQAAASAAKLFREQRVEKRYWVLVRGHCLPTGFIDRPLQQPDAQDPEPRPASTSFETEALYDIPLRSDRFPTTHCSLVRVMPHTGRFHQIRRHMNGISHPVIADTSHGDGRQNAFFRKRFGVARLMLHAGTLSFRHPVTQADVHIECPLPLDFTSVLQELEPHEI